MKKKNRVCLYCKKEYFGYGKQFCSLSCRTSFWNKKRNPSSTPEGRKRISKMNKGNTYKRGKGQGGNHLGYRVISFYVNGKQKFIPEHHLVFMKFNNLMEIPKGFIIHHLNGNRKDNQIENLIMISRKEHAKIHWDQKDIRNGRKKTCSTS